MLDNGSYLHQHNRESQILVPISSNLTGHSMLRAAAKYSRHGIRCWVGAATLCVMGLLLSLLIATAAYANTDAGSNDVFASAQFLQPGSLSVSGELDPVTTGDLIAQESGNLFPGGVLFHDFFVTPGGTFSAAIDNSASGTDTTLGSFDQSFNLIATDDDSSPLGTGLGSGLRLTGNPDGTIHLRVSGFSDFDFDGISDGGTAAHSQSGAYEILLFEGGSVGDVDLFAFTGLPEGQRYLAETFAGPTGTPPDTVLGLFDNFGNIVLTDDDGGAGTLSQMEVTVPDGGTLFLGVSGFSDFGFTGQHAQTGSYSLALQAIPEPTGVVVLAFALVVSGLRRTR